MRDTFLSDDCGRKRRSPSSSFELSVKSAATFIKWRHSSCLLWSSSSTLAFQEESNDGPSYTQPRDMLAAVVFSPAVPTDTFTFLHGQRRLHFCLAFLFNILNCLFRLLSCFHYSFIHCVKGKQTGRKIIMMSTTKKKKETNKWQNPIVDKICTRLRFLLGFPRQRRRWHLQFNHLCQSIHMKKQSWKRRRRGGSMSF